MGCGSFRVLPRYNLHGSGTRADLFRGLGQRSFLRLRCEISERAATSNLAHHQSDATHVRRPLPTQCTDATFTYSNLARVRSMKRQLSPARTGYCVDKQRRHTRPMQRSRRCCRITWTKHVCRLRCGHADHEKRRWRQPARGVAGSARAVRKESHHLRGGIRTVGIRETSGRVASGPGVAAAFDDPVFGGDASIG